ncbi:hypothetical protein HDU67_000136 [Dinochytrium kinnereticum]|nr:hypothetical protein HDU67_000136 [Dinochytrium kinnereticum]
MADASATSRAASRPTTAKSSMGDDRVPSDASTPKPQSNTRPQTPQSPVTRPKTSRGNPPSRPTSAAASAITGDSRGSTPRPSTRSSTAPRDSSASKSPANGSKSRPSSPLKGETPEDVPSPRSSRSVTPKPASPKASSPKPSTPRMTSKAATPVSLSRSTSSTRIVPASVDKGEIVRAIRADQEVASMAGSRPVSAKNGMRSGSARVLRTLEAAADAGKTGVAVKALSRHSLLKASQSLEVLVKTMPRSGGWVGWYSTSDSEMTKIFFEVALSIDGQGNLSGGPREESSPFSCIGTVSKNEPHKVSFLETERFGHDIQFDGVFVESAIAGRWHKNQAADPRGRLCLFRISDRDPSVKMPFRNGRWAGCCWSEKEKDWIQVSFAWLEIRDSIIYGKDELTDDNVFITTRGTFDRTTGKIRIMVTEWFEQDSSFRVYSGVLAQDGHVRGLWTSSEERDLDDDDESIYDAVPEEEEATFRVWRVDGDDAIEWLPKEGHPELDARIPESKWTGTWTYDGGIQSTDHCTWNLRFLSGKNRIQGEGTLKKDLFAMVGLAFQPPRSVSNDRSVMETGSYDREKNTIKLYQSYLTTLSVYVYDLSFGENGCIIGKGSSKDDSDGLVVDFKLTRI